MSNIGPGNALLSAAIPREYTPMSERAGNPYLLLMLFCLNAISFIDRKLLAAFVVDIRADLGLSYFQFSLLAGPVFSIAYIATAIPAGMMADRMDRPRLIAGAVGLWSLLTAATGACTSFAQMIAARAIVGVGEAGLTPASISMLTDIYPQRRHGLVLSLFYLGALLGGGGSLLVAALLGPTIGWRGCFFALGVLGIGFTVLLLFVSDPRKSVQSQQSAADRSSDLPQKASLKECLILISRSAPIRLVLLAGCIYFVALSSIILDQAWLVSERGFSVQGGQLTFGLMMLVPGVIGAWASGWLSDRAARYGLKGRLFFLACAALAFAVGSAVFRLAPQGTFPFYLGALISYILILAPMGSIMAALTELIPPHMKSTITAVAMVTFAGIGTAGGNAMGGWLGDVMTSSKAQEPLTLALLMINSLAVIAAFFFVIAARAARNANAENKSQAG